MKSLLTKYLLRLYCLCTCLYSYSQDSTNVAGLFEGKVTYVHQILNPNKGLISDEEFFRDLPNAGKSIVTLYIKSNQYKWEYEDRIEYYYPKNQQIVIVSKRLQDSIYMTSATLVEEKVEKLIKSNLTKRLLGYSLSAQEIHTKWDTKTFFYSPLALKTNATFWRQHKYNYLSEMTGTAKAFPMIIHNQSLLGNWIMAVSKIEPMLLDETYFALPSSK